MALLTAQGMRDLLDRSENDNLPDLGDDEFLDFASRFNQFVYTMLYALNPNDYIVDEDITTIVGVSEYALTNVLFNYKLLDTGLFDSCDREVPEVSRRSKCRGFWNKGNSIMITPVPTVIETFTFSSISKIPNFTDIENDVSVIDDIFSDYIKDSINIYFYEWSENKKEIGSSERVQGSLLEFKKNAKKAPAVFNLS